MIQPFKMYIGTVIETIDTVDENSTKLKVYVPDLLPLNLNSDVEPAEYKFKMKNEKDESESVVIKNKGFIICDYFNNISNRLNPPVIHAAERVYVFQIGDPDIFHWLPINLDHKKRSTEHSKFVIADRPADQVDTELTDENTWFAEVDTRGKKLIHLHTSESDEEPVGYDVKINPTEQLLTIEDTLGNKLTWKSDTPSIKVENSSGSYVDLNKENIIIDCPKDVRITAGRQMVIDTPNFTSTNEITKFNSGGFGVAASNVFAVASPCIGLDGVVASGGVLNSAGLVLAGGIGAGAAPVFPMPVTVPGSNSEESSAGTGTNSPATPPPAAVLSTNFACDWVLIKTAIDALADYCATVTYPASFTGADVVKANTAAAQLLHITDSI